MNMQFHEVANIFPLMDGASYKELRDDIGANGLIEPVWIWKEKIVDGRNRYRACTELGIEPDYREWKGPEEGLLPFVISLNLKRRHLNESQRAMVAAKVANMRQGERTDIEPSANLQKVSQPDAAKMFNVSPRLVAMAKRVYESAPADVVKEIVDGKLAVSQYARQINRAEKIGEIVQNNKPLNGNGKRYSVIYADPPWKYDFSDSLSRAVENHYPTMELEEIKSLPVQDIAADQAILFLWCPPAFTKKAIGVLEAWGFEYRTNMVWVKDRIGSGQWVRQRHELLLIGRRGDFPTPEGGNRPDSVIESPRQEHSKKPDDTYSIIESMYPELERIELFARNKRTGWKGWGNQA